MPHGLSLLLLAMTLQATPDAGPRVTGVELRGRLSLGDDMLRSVLEVRPPRCRSPFLILPCALGTFTWAEVFDRLEQGELARDSARLDSLYNAWGYPDAAVVPRLQRETDGVRVVFEIDEGRPTLVDSVAVESGVAFEPPLKVDDLPLARGRPYALPLLDATIARLRERAAEYGYAWADVEVSGDIDPATGGARVVLRIVPGPVARFGPVRILTEPPLRPSTLEPFLAHEEGERFRPTRVDETLRRLRALPVVEDAGVQLRAMPPDTVIPTIVGVRAARVHGFGIEGTVASVTCLSLFGRWQHRHLLGAPRVLTLSVGAANLFAEETGGFPCSGTGEGEFGGRDWMLDADLWQPAFLGDARTTLGLGVFTERWSLANAFIREGAGVRIALTRELSRTAALRLQWLPERSRRHAAELYFCGNYAFCTRQQLDDAAALHWFAPVRASLLLTSWPAPGGVERPRPWWADIGTPVPAWSWGLRSDVDGAGSATGSDYGFVRGAIEAAITRRFGRTAELAARVKVAALTGDRVLPPDARLFAGGLTSVRGAGQSLLGPVVLLADSVAAAPCLPPRNVCLLPAADPEHVRLRPLGADRVLEAAIEARLWLSDRVQLAAFADFGTTGLRDEDAVAEGLALNRRRESLLSPGIGIRAISPAGPLRLDLALDPRSPRALPLYMRSADGIAFLGQARYDPFTWDDPGGWTELRRRLRIWLGIGQPF